jgi:hypothetical protein
MSIAIFGFVRSMPKVEKRTSALERRAADCSAKWARRFERLAELVEATSADCRQTEAT